MQNNISGVFCISLQPVPCNLQHPLCRATLCPVTFNASCTLQLVPCNLQYLPVPCNLYPVTHTPFSFLPNPFQTNRLAHFDALTRVGE